MKYLQYTAYVYLAAAAFFLVQGIMQLNSGEQGSWLSFFLVAMSVFMFFFRRRFSKKMSQNNRNRQNPS